MPRNKPPRKKKRPPLIKRGDDEWIISAPEEVIAPLRTDERFHRILDLARHVNALRYAMSATASVGYRDDPNAVRQRAGTFFYFAGVLYEAFELVQVLRSHYGNTPLWADSLGVYGSEDEVRSRLARGGDLHTLRNHTAFHVTAQVAPRSLKKLRMPEYTFASGKGRQSGMVYYNLADTVAIHYAVGAPADGDILMPEFLRVAEETRDLALDFIRQSDKLIARCLLAWGFTKKDSRPAV